MPRLFSTLSQYRMIPNSFRPGSSSDTDTRPLGRDNGESMETKCGRAASVLAIMDSSSLTEPVVACEPSSRHQPDGRLSEPVKSTPTIRSASRFFGNKSAKEIGATAPFTYGTSLIWPVILETLLPFASESLRGTKNRGIPSRIRRGTFCCLNNRSTALSKMNRMPSISQWLYLTRSFSASRSPLRYRCHSSGAVSPFTSANSSGRLKPMLCSIAFCPPTSPTRLERNLRSICAGGIGRSANPSRRKGKSNREPLNVTIALASASAVRKALVSSP